MADPAQCRIVNTALSALGQEPVTDLSEPSLQGSVSATKLMRVIEAARDSVLGRHGWLRALTYATLTPAVLAETANWRYPTAFLTPGDCLRVWEIEGQTWCADLPGGWGPRWQVNTIEVADAARQVIRAGSPVAGGLGALDSLYCAYVRRANWAALGAQLEDAIAYETAARAAYSITAERSTAADKRKEAEAAIALAISGDGTQEGGQPPAAPSIPASIRNMSR